MYQIKTESNKYYNIDNDNNIIRLDMKDFQPSNKWKLIGFVKILPFNNLSTIINIDRLLDCDIKFKNGKGKYLLIDLDHGTTRQWGDRITRIEKL